jgi:hypothetical protein
MAPPDSGPLGVISGQNSRPLKLHRLATANDRLRVAEHGWIRGVNIAPREIAAFGDVPTGYEEFVDRATAKETIDTVIMAEVPDIQIPISQPPILDKSSQ